MIIAILYLENSIGIIIVVEKVNLNKRVCLLS